MAGCATPPEPKPPPEVTAEPAPTPLDPVILDKLNPQSDILIEKLENEGPWDLVERADRATLDAAIDLRLDAIDGFLDLQEFTPAETQANYLLDVTLNRIQSNRFSLQRARIAVGFGQHETAIRYLEPLRDDPLWTPSEWARVLKSLSDAQLALGLRVDALINLFQRDQLLVGEDQLVSQQRIIDLLEQTSSLEQALLQQHASNLGLPTNLVGGWLTLVALRELPIPERMRAARLWYNSYPRHPARGEWLSGIPEQNLDYFRQITLLLPLQSSYAHAALAFQEGFLDAYHQDAQETKPAVHVLDIGEDPSLASFYYQSAVTSGADFVVGPLGREATATLLESTTPDIPTLVLADVSHDTSSDQLYGLSLSPEREAVQIASRAFRDGHRHAGIIHDGSHWAARVIAAFSEHWLFLGGTLGSNWAYPDAIDQYARLISQFLEVDQSIARRKQLTATVGRNLEFTPRRRGDIDMIFLVGNARDARLLVPQLRFHQAHNLPIYSTSNIFSGKPDPAVDADLDGLIFGDMPWMLDIRYTTEARTHSFPSRKLAAGNGPNSMPSEPSEEEVSPISQSGTTALPNAHAIGEPSDTLSPPKRSPLLQPVEKSPYSFTPLDRLYALGLETYSLIPRLKTLRGEASQPYYGQAFQASVEANGNVVRHLVWATFDQGEVVLLAPE